MGKLGGRRGARGEEEAGEEEEGGGGGRGRENSNQREKHCLSAHLCSPRSLLSAVLAGFQTPPLGLINGWPHLFDWKCTSSWFWNIGKYALSSSPGQKLAQCLRIGLVESQETGNNGPSRGSYSVRRIRLLSFWTLGLLTSMTLQRGDHPTHAAEPHMK